MFRALIQKETRRQGLSGYALAKLAGLPMRTVQQYLAGDCDLRGESVARVATALGLELRPQRRGRRKG